MVAKWILLFLLAFPCLPVHSQLNQETHSRAQWKGLGFINGTNLNRFTKTCGIYNTSSDRQSGKLTVAIDCRSEDHKIKSGFMRDRSAIKIVRNNETYKYLRNDIFGYRDCNGNEYHFFEGKSYQLLNPGEDIAIYRIYEWRGKQRVTKYFFSRALADTIKPLTLENLSAEFSHEPLFLEKLRVLAKNDLMLIKYMHAINRVRMNALQENESIVRAL